MGEQSTWQRLLQDLATAGHRIGSSPGQRKTKKAAAATDNLAALFQDRRQFIIVTWQHMAKYVAEQNCSLFT